MNHSESLTKLAPAFVAAQAEIENAHKNAKNPHFKSTYADLAEIIDTIRPTLAKHGLAVVQIPGFESGVLTMDNMILHTSGEWISGVSGSPVAKQDPQGVGSAITYMRRYSLAAMCGIAQEDDDGQAASSAKKLREPKPQTAPAGPPIPATAEQIATITEMWKRADIPEEKGLKIGTKLEENSFTFDEAAGTITYLANKPVRA